MVSMRALLPKSRLYKALTAFGLLCGGAGLIAIRHYSWHEAENTPLVTHMPNNLIPRDIELLVRNVPKTPTIGPRLLVSEEDLVHFKVVLHIATREAHESFISQVEKLSVSEQSRLLENLKTLQIKEEQYRTVAHFEKDTGAPLSTPSKVVFANGDPVQNTANNAYDRVFNARANVEEEYNRAVELGLMAAFYRAGGKLTVLSRNQLKIDLPDDATLPLESINKILSKAVAEFPTPTRDR